jgi:hypothetical protein
VCSAKIAMGRLLSMCVGVCGYAVLYYGGINRSDVPQLCFADYSLRASMMM